MYSKKFEKLIYDYFAFVTNLPLQEAFAPPVFNHYTVLETWKEAFAEVLARCKDEDITSLTRSATKTEIGNLVKHRVAKSSWHVVLKACSHTPGIEEMCPRCEKELGIARQAIIEQANLSAQAVLGTDSGDYIHAQIWSCMAENAFCKTCYEREYVACLCAFDFAHHNKMPQILWDWRKRNKALSIDIHYRTRYLDFMMRHVEYESCLVCPKNQHNIKLPLNKRLCLCEQSERSMCIFDTLKNDTNINLATIDVKTTYAMIRHMLETFVFHVVEDGAIVSQV